VHGYVCGVKYLYSKYRCVDVLSTVLDEWVVKRPHLLKAVPPNFEAASELFIHDLEEQRYSTHLLLDDLRSERRYYQDILDFERCPSDHCEMKEEESLFDKGIKHKGFNYRLGGMIEFWSKTF
jgi:hypothetical protein